MLNASESSIVNIVDEVILNSAADAMVTKHNKVPDAGGNQKSDGRGPGSFDGKTREEIAKRAGYMCCFPGCQQFTVCGNPGDYSSKKILCGVAAHIIAASPDGPRGDATKDKAFIKSAENGIWMCSAHDKTIDSNPKIFSIDRIIAMRTAHEHSLFVRVSGIKQKSRENGVIWDVKFHHFLACNPYVEMRLSQLTVVYGNGQSREKDESGKRPSGRGPPGKSLMCEVLHALSTGNMGRRRSVQDECYVKIQYLRGLNFEFTMNSPPNTFDADTETHKVNFARNGVFYPHDRLNFINSLYVDLDKEGRSFADLAKVFGISAVTLHTFIEHVCIHKPYDGMFFKGMKMVNEEQEDGKIERILQVSCIQHRAGLYIPYRNLSSSEKKLLLIQLGLCLAQFFGETSTTLLIIDHFNTYVYALETDAMGNKRDPGALDKAAMEIITRHMSREDVNFQLIICPSGDEEQIEAVNRIMHRRLSNPNCVAFYNLTEDGAIKFEAV